MNRDEAGAWLDAHVNLETGVGVPTGRDRRRDAPTLDRIRALVELLGDPQDSYPCVHITGTNGKTSVARITSALLTGRGLSVGTITSPHLARAEERICRDGEPVDDESFADIVTRLALVEEHLPDRPSWFELVVAAALTWFADIAVDVAVVEVGVGGTWDATNVVHGQVAVVTNVTIDHVEYLGPTRDDIAREKAGIVEPGAHLVLGETDPALEAIFTARQPGVVWRRDREFGVHHDRLALGGRSLDLFVPGARYPDTFLSLHGAHQGDNAAIGLAAATAFLGSPLEEGIVRDVLGTVASPGRLEVVDHQPLVLLDGAHNVAGAQALVRALDEGFASSRRTLVVGLLQEKDPREMLEALEVARAGSLVCCAPPSRRALDARDVAAAAIELGLRPNQVEIASSVRDAIRRAREGTPTDGQIIVTGSLYLVGAAREVLAR